MGDFISNNPDGKSDLHTFAPPPQPPVPEQAPAAPIQQPRAEQSPVQAEQPVAASMPTTEVLSAQASTAPEAPSQAAPQQTCDPSAAQTVNQPTSQPTGQPYGYPGAYQNPNQAQYPYQNPYAYAAYGQQPPKKSPKENYNVASMVLGIVSWVGLILCCGCFSPFTAVISIILAFMGKENGKFSGKAVAGIILSIIFLVIFAFFMLILILGMSGTFDEPEVSGDLVEMMIAFISSHH